MIIEHERNGLSLPGGHLEINETPDDAMRREINEELNIVYEETLLHKDFWLHPNGKIILGFIGKLSSSTIFNINRQELVDAKWVLLDDIKSGKTSTGTYDEFIISNADFYKEK